MLTFDKDADFVKASPFKTSADGSLLWSALVDGKNITGRIWPTSEITDEEGNTTRLIDRAFELAAEGLITIEPYTDEERLNDLAEEVRAQRDNKLNALDRIVANPLRWDSFTQAQRDEFSSYRLALLDVPQQEGFPESVEWPSLSFTP